MFSTFATLHDKGFNIYCLSCMQDYGNKNVITYRKQEVKKEQEELDMAAQMSKSMSWFMPIMAVSISLIAPLGLALYWLVNNILMIFERLVLNKILDSKKEA